MNFSFLSGLVVSLIAIYLMVTLEHASFSALFLPAPMILVFGVTIGIGIMANPFKEWLASMKAVPGALFGKLPHPAGEIDTIVEMAEIARRPDKGLLALENEADRVTEPLLSAALIDMSSGVDSEALRSKMLKRLRAVVSRKQAAAAVFLSMGGTAPTIGIVGTVISLTHVLSNLDQPDQLGPMISAAFVATLWGLSSANLIWMPIGEKLARIAALEQLRLQVILEGCVQILDGTSPRDLREILDGMAGPAAKGGKKDKSAKAKFAGDA